MVLLFKQFPTYWDIKLDSLNRTSTVPRLADRLQSNDSVLLFSLHTLQQRPCHAMNASNTRVCKLVKCRRRHIEIEFGATGALVLNRHRDTFATSCTFQMVNARPSYTDPVLLLTCSLDLTSTHWVAVGLRATENHDDMICICLAGLKAGHHSQAVKERGGNSDHKV